MNNRWAFLLLAALAGSALPGCSTLKEAVFGRENPLAPLSWASLGSTPRDEIMRRFGAPDEIDGRWFESLEAEVFFYYDSNNGNPPDYRLLVCEFSKGVLTAYAYQDSTQAEAAGFEDGQLAKLVRGRSTRAEVENALGSPSGKAKLPTTITLPALFLKLGGGPFPLTKIPEAAQEVWQYHRSGVDEKLRKTEQKNLSVFFDAQGLFIGSTLLQERLSKY